MTALRTEELSRYGRQISLCEMGIEGQLKLKAASVLVVGAGALGCAAMQYLVAAGIGRVGVVDHDVVDHSNLHRQVLYSEADIGQPKVQVARQGLTKINPHVEIIALDVRLDSTNAVDLVSPYNLVLDACDNFSTRYAINRACLEKDKPWIYASLSQFQGQIALFNGVDQAGQRGPHYEQLFPVALRDHQVPTCAISGVIGAFPGMIGFLQAIEAIKWVAGIGDSLSGKLLLIDAKTWSVKMYEVKC